MIPMNERTASPVPLFAAPEFDALYIELGDHVMGFLAAEAIPNSMFAGERWIRILAIRARWESDRRRTLAVMCS